MTLSNSSASVTSVGTGTLESAELAFPVKTQVVTAILQPPPSNRNEKRKGKNHAYFHPAFDFSTHFMDDKTRMSIENHVRRQNSVPQSSFNQPPSFNMSFEPKQINPRNNFEVKESRTTQTEILIPAHSNAEVSIPEMILPQSPLQPHSNSVIDVVHGFEEETKEKITSVSGTNPVEKAGNHVTTQKKTPTRISREGRKKSKITQFPPAFVVRHVKHEDVFKLTGKDLKKSKLKTTFKTIPKPMKSPKKQESPLYSHLEQISPKSRGIPLCPIAKSVKEQQFEIERNEILRFIQMTKAKFSRQISSPYRKSPIPRSHESPKSVRPDSPIRRLKRPAGSPSYIPLSISPSKKSFKHNDSSTNKSPTRENLPFTIPLVLDHITYEIPMNIDIENNVRRKRFREEMDKIWEENF